VIPVWFREEAETICRRTLADGGGKPLAQRIADALARFLELDVLEADLVRRVGRPVSEWTATTVGALVTTYQSLKRGEISREEAFPPDLVSAEEIARQAAPAPAAESPAEVEPPRPTRESDVDAWHKAGHPSDTGARASWDPECPACDPGGRFHYYDHGEPEEGCVWCLRDAAYRTEDGR
jgi:hypothetical protein